MLVMDVSLFLFVVSQECSFSHAVNHTHGHTHTVLSLCKAQGEREEGDEGGAGVNLIPLGPNDTPETLRRAGEATRKAECNLL